MKFATESKGSISKVDNLYDRMDVKQKNALKSQAFRQAKFNMPHFKKERFDINNKFEFGEFSADKTNKIL